MEQEFAALARGHKLVADPQDWLGMPVDRSVVPVPYVGAPAFPRQEPTPGTADDRDEYGLAHFGAEVGSAAMLAGTGIYSGAQSPESTGPAEDPTGEAPPPETGDNGDHGPHTDPTTVVDGLDALPASGEWHGPEGGGDVDETAEGAAPASPGRRPGDTDDATAGAGEEASEEDASTVEQDAGEEAENAPESNASEPTSSVGGSAGSLDTPPDDMLAAGDDTPSADPEAGHVEELPEQSEERAVSTLMEAEPSIEEAPGAQDADSTGARAPVESAFRSVGEPLTALAAQPTIPVGSSQPQQAPSPTATPATVSATDAATAMSLVSGLANGVIPNDAKQQEHALLGVADPQSLLADDPKLAKDIKAVAERRARRARDSNKSTVRRQHRRGGAVAAGVIDADNKFEQNITKMAARSAEQRVPGVFKSRMAGTQRMTAPVRGTDEMVNNIAQRADHAAKVNKETRADLVAQETRRLRNNFLLWGGRILHVRHPGKPALSSLRKAERALVRQLKRSRQPDVVIQQRVWQLRAQHAARFKPKLAKIKRSFLLAAENELQFRFNKEHLSRHRPSFGRPRNDPRGLTTVGQTGGVIGGRSSLPIANAIVDFGRRLLVLGVRAKLNTYDTHSLGPYSVDVFPDGYSKANGFHDPAQMVRLFKKIAQAAGDTHVRWRALYNDFAVAQAVNRHTRRRHVHFKWEHGPSPFVQHVHLDVVPKTQP